MYSISTTRFFIKGVLLMLGSMLIAFASMAANLPKASVQTKKLEAKQLGDLLTYPAVVRARAEANLTAEAEGVISKVYYKLGDSVEKGKVLFTIERLDPVYRYTPFKVLAPLSGRIAKLDVVAGTPITRGQSIAQILDLSQVKLIAEAPGRDLKLLQQGLKGTFSVAGISQALTLAQLTPSIDDLTGTAKLELIPTEQSNALTPGQIVRVQFEVNLREAISIPDHAISYKGSTPFVRVAIPTADKPNFSTAKQVTVTLGRKSNGMVEVLDGLKASDVLIERASRYLSDNELIETPATL